MARGWQRAFLTLRMSFTALVFAAWGPPVAIVSDINSLYILRGRQHHNTTIRKANRSVRVGKCSRSKLLCSVVCRQQSGTSIAASVQDT